MYNLHSQEGGFVIETAPMMMSLLVMSNHANLQW
jgi:hypothetical protein